MKNRKLLIVVLAAICALFLCTGLAACDGDEEKPVDGGETYTLDAPQIGLDGSVIGWEEVENATGYEVFESADGGEYVSKGAVTAASYTIEVFDHALYKYKVKAVGDGESYLDSGFSNEVEYSLPYTYTVDITVPEDYVGTEFTAGLYSGAELLDSCTVTVETEGPSLANLTADEEGDYIVRLSGIGQDYAANWVRVYSESDRGSIKIVKVTADNVLNLGENTFELTDADGDADNGNYSKDYVYYIEDTTTYSLRTSSEGLFISVSGNTVIDVNHGFSVGSFSAEEGETVIVTVITAALGSYAAELVDYEIAQYIKAMSLFNLDYLDELMYPDGEFPEAERFREEYATCENRILQRSCNRYINVTEDVTYTFQFFLGSLGTLKLTLTVGGTDYVIDGGTAFVNIPFTAGEDIQIHISVSGGSMPSEGVGFYVFPATEDL